MSGIDTLRGMGKRHVPKPRHPREDGAPEAPTTHTEMAAEAPLDDDTLPEFDISTSTSPTARGPRSTPATPDRGGEEGMTATAQPRQQQRAHATAATPAATTTTTRGYQRREEDQVNLGVRVPRDLDNKLMGLVYHLRLQGVRASKAELVALALENLPQEPTPALTRALHKQRP